MSHFKKQICAHSNFKKNFKVLDETLANSIRGKEGTKSPSQKSKTQELF
jgi:hypothetical protein